MLIDFHTHAFAEKIAPRAVQQLIDYYQLPTTFGGSLQDLLKIAGDVKLDALVLLNAATRPEQVRPANDWLIEIGKPVGFQPESKVAATQSCRVIPFGTFHIQSPDWLSEVQRLRAAGIAGIKLHPEFQGIDLADKRLNDEEKERIRDINAARLLGII
jgi:uncharacterized protein